MSTGKDIGNLPLATLSGDLKIPTGGFGDYAITLDQIKEYTKTAGQIYETTSPNLLVDNGVFQNLTLTGAGKLTADIGSPEYIMVRVSGDYTLDLSDFLVLNGYTDESGRDRFLLIFNILGQKFLVGSAITDAGVTPPEPEVQELSLKFSPASDSEFSAWLSIRGVPLSSVANFLDVSRGATITGLSTQNVSVDWSEVDKDYWGSKPVLLGFKFNKAVTDSILATLNDSIVLGTNSSSYTKNGTTTENSGNFTVGTLRALISSQETSVIGEDYVYLSDYGNADDVINLTSNLNLNYSDAKFTVKGLQFQVVVGKDSVVPETQTLKFDFAPASESEYSAWLASKGGDLSIVANPFANSGATFTGLGTQNVLMDWSEIDADTIGNKSVFLGVSFDKAVADSILATLADSTVLGSLTIAMRNPPSSTPTPVVQDFTVGTLRSWVNDSSKIATVNGKYVSLDYYGGAANKWAFNYNLNLNYTDDKFVVTDDLSFEVRIGKEAAASGDEYLGFTFDINTNPTVYPEYYVLHNYATGSEIQMINNAFEYGRAGLLGVTLNAGTSTPTARLYNKGSAAKDIGLGYYPDDQNYYINIEPELNGVLLAGNTVRATVIPSTPEYDLNVGAIDSSNILSSVTVNVPVEYAGNQVAVLIVPPDNSTQVASGSIVGSDGSVNIQNIDLTPIASYMADGYGLTLMVVNNQGTPQFTMQTGLFK